MFLKREVLKSNTPEDVIAALADLWDIFGHICAERLHPQVNEFIRVLSLKDEWKHGDLATGKLRAMSLGTMKLKIGEIERRRGFVGKSSTRSSVIKEIVPIRRGPWQNPDPGCGEGDTVAHCGSSLIGDYAYTVQYTDVSTIWTLLQAQWNKGMVATKDSLLAMQERCPFLIIWFDFDSGGEFINKEVIKALHNFDPPIKVTRTRPYKKNDHARIEQKQYTNVRKWVGYYRYDKPEQVAVLNELYLLLEDYINFFIPSMKCLSKEKQGSRYKRIYEEAKTAYQRVLAHKKIDKKIKKSLQEKYAKLNPKELKDKIDKLQKRLFLSVKKRGLQ